ncbi:MAG: redoxin domain-containing protein [Ignavibacteriae bacterium]|nr:redoxin domain-containing protein [Ignavibacteriota bacterium]
MDQRGATRLMVLFLTTLLVPQAHATEGPKLGNRAPDFTLPYATMDTIDRAGLTLSKAIGARNIILAFYPADWSGGCTKEMCTMRDNIGSLAELGAEVYGISGDYVYSHHEWAKHHSLQFPLLSDHNHEVATAYASFNPTSGYNRRTVYVVDRSGYIAYVDLEYSVRTPESFEKLKAALATLK